MASLREIRNKDGALVGYTIRVYRGRDATGKQLKPLTRTFHVMRTWSEKTARKKAEAYAAQLEDEYKKGLVADSRLKFAEYCDYVIQLKEKRGVKHSTIARYKELTTRIYPEIGHLYLRDIRVDHLNSLYTKLSEEGKKKTLDRAKAKVDLRSILKEKKISCAEIARESGLAASTVAAAVRGQSVSRDTAEKVSEVLNISLKRSFQIIENSDTLSAKTVLEHHRLICTVLKQAVKEGLIPFNPAAKADPPRYQRDEVNYYSVETVFAILDALEKEPLKWRAIVHLILITGARRGEILGLKWNVVDFKHNRIHIENNIQYTADKGIYEETPKTKKSIRWVALPKETMDLMSEWKKQQDEDRAKLGDYYQDRQLLFAQKDGRPMHPDSVTGWMNKFSERHNLPHINPQAFRHTMASVLFSEGADAVAVSGRLGHAQVSTTANIYAHLMEKSDNKNLDILSEVILHRKGENE